MQPVSRLPRNGIAVDIGGTFTDLVFFDSMNGQLRIAKSLTTTDTLVEGVMDAISSSVTSLADVELFVHGTTVVINTITERKGARIALICTEGFRDVLEIGRANRPDMYNFRYHKPEPFVPRRLRFEVRERLDKTGAVVTPLLLSDLDDIIAACQAEHIQAIAICFLHAYANPAHERMAATYIRRYMPDVAVTASHTISRQWREYERTSTAVLNAYVQPIATSYLTMVEDTLHTHGFNGSIAIMQSSGGTTTLPLARERPITLLESGPVAGVVGAARLGEFIGEPNVVSLDIGGTTAKCSLVEGGQVQSVTDYRVARSSFSQGYPLQIPVVDIVEIGAGGGSIVRLDATGAVRVGPESAGAAPGPACYGLGGTEPTVTDASLLAGWLNAEYFAGGKIQLRAELAEAAYARFGRMLGISALEAAIGSLRLANATMIDMLKLVSIQRGYDPRSFVLVVSGGGGPLHGALLARELCFRKVIVPRIPGVFSAWGMLLVEPRMDFVRTCVTSADDETTLRAVLDEMKDEARSLLRRDDLSYQSAIDMRYEGQEHTVRVVLDEPTTPAAIVEAFHVIHYRRYRFELRTTPVEIVNVHLSVYTPSLRPSIMRWQPNTTDACAPKAERMVYFGELGWHTSLVYERDLLPSGFRRRGPLVIEEPTSTTLVPPDMLVWVDAYGNLHLTGL